DLVDASADEVAEAKALGEKTPRGLGTTLFDRWARAVEEAGKSQTPRLILEMALVDLCFAEPLLPLGDLLKRLEEMETQLHDRPGGPGGGGRTGPATRERAGGDGGWPAPEATRPAPPPRPSRTADAVAPAARAPEPAPSRPPEPPAPRPRAADPAPPPPAPAPPPP